MIITLKYTKAKIKMKVGSLINFLAGSNKTYIGLVIESHNIDKDGAEFTPPMLDILWQNGDIEPVWQDEINMLKDSIEVIT